MPIRPNLHQPNEKPIKVRRGEGGVERLGGPLWSPVAGAPSPAHEQTGATTRATIKAHFTHPNHPRPYGLVWSSSVDED